MTTTPHIERSIQNRKNERGNLLFIVLLAVFLIGLLTVAIQSGMNSETSDIDDERLAIKAGEVQRFASEVERAVLFLYNQGIGESQIRFAHPDADDDYGDLNADTDPTNQVFHPDGGAALYRSVPQGIQLNTSNWEFFGRTHAPGAGLESRADLMIVLPNVSQGFCDAINRLNGQTDNQPLDPGGSTGCVFSGTSDRFDDTTQFITTGINEMNETSFTRIPALQACVQCSSGENHFYHVLLAR